MWVSKEMACEIKIKRALGNIGIKRLAKELKTSYQTLKKVENGDYDLNKRVFDSIDKWLKNEKE